MGPNQIYLMITFATAFAFIFISLRILRVFRQRGEIRKAVRLTREYLRDIGSHADHLRTRRGQTLRGNLPYPTAATGWESEKKTFISVHLRPILKQIRSESDRATAATQCSKFIELIASSPNVDQDVAGSEITAATVRAPF